MNNDTSLLSEWSLPDSEICTAAWKLAFEVSPEFLANHCVRSYLFSRELAAADGLRSGADYDDELVFLSCLLHDLGLTDYGQGDQRFEVEGADAAVRFLDDQGVPADRTSTVWQAIALHTSLGLAGRFGTEQSVVHNGISVDIDGMASGRFSTGFADRVHAAWPRHDLGYAIVGLVAQGTRANPQKAPPFTFPAHAHEAINGSSITFLDVVEASPWGDRPVAGPAQQDSAR